VEDSLANEPSDPQPSDAGQKKTPIQIDPGQLEKARAEVRDILAQALNPASPRMVFDEKGTLRPVYPDKKTGYGLLMKAMGTTDGEFMQGILDQVSGLCYGTPADKAAQANFALSVIRDVKPQNHLEGMLAVQIAAVHLSTMKMAGNISWMRDCPEREGTERGLNRLTRTFMSQLEALKRFRGNGEQKITVQYVTVKDGSQAILGDVTHAPTVVKKRRGKGGANRPRDKHHPGESSMTTVTFGGGAETVK
jgi:hypothetical protein